MPHHNHMQDARDWHKLSRETGCQTLEKIAMVSTVVVALGAVMQSTHLLLRNFNKKEEHDRGKRR